MRGASASSIRLVRARRFSTRPGSRRAVLLVDVIVGTVIIGVSLAALIGVLGRAITSQSNGEKLQTAAALIDEQLNLVLMRGADNYAGRFAAEGECDVPFQDFRYRVDVGGGSTGAPYQVRATVYWVSGGRERSASASTLIAPRLGEEPDPIRTPDQPVERIQ